MGLPLSRNDPWIDEVAAKDVWRAGGSGDLLYQSYADMYTRLFDHA
jgi:hypothetical protein